MTEESVDADALIGVGEERQFAPRHARVLPSVLARELKWPFKTWLGTIDASELLYWTRSEAPPSSVADEIRRTTLKRLQPHRPELFQEPCGVMLDEAWMSGLDREEVIVVQRALRALGPDVQFEAQTLKVLKRHLAVPYPEVFRILAKLEAVYWRPGEAPSIRATEWAKRAARAPQKLEMGDALRARVEEVLSLPWIDRVERGDLRLAGPLGAAPGAWLREQLAAKHGISEELESTVARILDVARQTYAQEVESLVTVAVLNRRQRPRPGQLEQWLDIFKSRFVSPGKPPTLQELGDVRGVTRERIRQVVENVFESVQSVRAYKPALERVIRMAAHAVPCSVEEADRQLARELGEGAGILGAMELAEQLGDVEIGVQMSKVKVRVSGKYERAPMLETATEQRWSQVALRYAAAECANVGCTNILRMAGHMAMKEGIALGREDIVNVVAHAPGFAWLDEANGWFSVGATDRCASAMRLRKVLAAAQEPVSVDELAEAFVCDTRWFKDDNLNRTLSIPPTHVIQAMTRLWPFVKLQQYTKLVAVEKLDPHEELSELERLCVRIIEEGDGVAPAFQFQERGSAELGLSQPAISIVLSSSPILIRLEHGLYGLRGRRQGALALSKARALFAENMGHHLPGLDPDVFRIVVTDASLNRNEQYAVPARFVDRLAGKVMPIEGTARVARFSASGTLRGINRTFPELQVGDELVVRVLPTSVQISVVPAPKEETGTGPTAGSDVATISGRED